MNFNVVENMTGTCTVVVIRGAEIATVGGRITIVKYTDLGNAIKA